MLFNAGYILALAASINAVSALPTNATMAASASTSLIPGGKKAGSAGGRAVPFWKDHIGWWYDWTPEPENRGIVGVSMLWGSGHNGNEDAKRFAEFQKMTTVPEYLLGFNEPDCTGWDTSANMDVSEGTSLWNSMIVPKGNEGALLGSPSMCMQKDETWLKKFQSSGLARDWDFTAIHVYKPDMKGVQEDIDHYWNTYKKPIWVTEFGCVHDQDNFTPCSDQGEINNWIRNVVDLFEQNEHVMAYAYTDGGGLGTAWLPTVNNGQALSESGKTYLDAISKYA